MLQDGGLWPSSEVGRFRVLIQGCNRGSCEAKNLPQLSFSALGPGA